VAGEDWRMTPEESAVAMQGMMDDPWIESWGSRPRLNYRDACGLIHYPGGAGSGHPGIHYEGILDNGCLVGHKGTIYRIVGRAAVSKSTSPGSGSSTGTMCWFLRPIDGGKIIGHLWFEDLDIPGPLKIIALAACVGEDPRDPDVDSRATEARGLRKREARKPKERR